METDFSLVQLANGVHSVRSMVYGETMHPGLGPAAEGQILYVEQLRLVERFQKHAGEFVVWDIGLGAGANALTLFRAIHQVPGCLRMVSFDQSLAPLSFAREHRQALGYFTGFEPQVETLLSSQESSWRGPACAVTWRAVVGDFPALVRTAAPGAWGQPQVILFDPWSPVRNPEMWTAGLFSDLFRLIGTESPCVLATYSRSTFLRVTLLLAGFWVGAGAATGFKEETTLAANAPGLVPSLLDRRWLERARRSGSAEPLWEPRHSRQALAESTWLRLTNHPQFKKTYGPATTQ